MSGSQSVSSPIATGGSGTFFEQHVGAQFLALLLVRGIPPLLKDCQVEEVHFQTENLGWNTDDVLVVGNQGEDRRRKLVAQVKRSFTVSSNDEVCKKAFTDFWKDFNNQDQFDPETDRLALITLRGTTVLLDKFGSLLDCARASVNGSDFARRLSVQGLLSNKACDQAKAVRSILDEASEQAISDDDFWRFLCVLHVISLDLNTPTAQQESWTKTLLAQTSGEPDPIISADSTWRELLQIVGGTEGMPAAGSYRYDNLPEALRQRHTALTPRPGGYLGQLTDHSSVTLDGIRSTIADSVKVRREALEAKVVESLETTQITLISGAAGHGKSAVAKNVIGQIQENFFCLAFRAEEFAASHIDQSLSTIQNSLTATRLLSLLSAQGRIIILVESIERLLESSDRKAFMDLLRLARSDQSLHLLLTCRDYYVETVKMSLLEQVALSYKVINVDPFTDDELNQVSQEIPGISVAIQNLNLRKLIRSPYLLNMAARINWAADESLPDSEKEFRDRCWSEIIRSDVNAAGGRPREREQVFVELALRRAKELRPYISCDDFNADTLEVLRQDNLVAFSKDSLSLAAPAHDVLEDWAIIHWLNSRFAICEGESSALAEDIGGYPALRRSYRKWLSEMLEREFENADNFILNTFQDETLPAHFRDDTIICMLLFSSAEGFLLRNRTVLLADNGKLLIRVVHLLRVACKNSPSFLRGARGLTSQLLVPVGAAWAPVLRIISEELESLLPENFGVILGLVEDWSRQVASWKLRPDGYEDTGKIVVRLLEDLNGHKSRKRRRSALDILAKIPNSVPEIFRGFLQQAISERRCGDAASDLVELLLTEGSSYFACRDFPEEIANLAMSFFCLDEEDLANMREHGYRYEYSHHIEKNFGLRQYVEHTFSVPASAYRGPFWGLLRSHPDLGVDFITTFINHACSWYGEQKWPFNQQEQAWQTELNMPGENQPVTQWASERLYTMHRGTSAVHPYVLQSALMALERWLLYIAELENVNLESWLLKLLQESNNVAITAVVASICIAQPERCGEAGLALLSSKDIINLDRHRMVHDQAHTSTAKLIPSLQAKNKIYEEERLESDALPHRKSDLEFLAIKLQLSDQRENVWQIIDRHREVLPPPEEQSESDRLWRLALHRIDVRGFKFGDEVPASEVSRARASSNSEEENEQSYFALVPGAMEPDVQEIVDRGAEQTSKRNIKLSLWLWGHSAWSRDQENDPMSWQEMLSLARTYDSTNGQETHNPFEYAQGGPGFIASVCVRDHWDEMDPVACSWCIDRLIEEIEKYQEADDFVMQISQGSLSPDRAVAYTLPRVVQEFGISAVDKRITTAVAIALTHPVIEVTEHAAEGIGYYLGEAAPDFVMKCVGALAKKARLVWEFETLQQADSPRHETSYEDWTSNRNQYIQQILPEIRRDIVSGQTDVENELSSLEIHQIYTRYIIRLIFQILGYLQRSEIAKNSYGRLAQTLIQEWTRDKQSSYGNNQRYFEFESWCETRIARFALKLEAGDAISICQPILQAIEGNPKEVAEFIEALIHEEDKSEQETPFWEIWQAFAERFINARWINHLDQQYDSAQLLSKLLLGVSWKEDVRSWSRLKSQESRIEAFVKSIPPSSVAFKAYCRFLYHIGEKSLPGSFIVVAERLAAGDSSQTLTDSNTTYYLELLLRRFVYGEPLQLKSNRGTREAVLYILDQLVDAGSSAAYQMRDDFVTPISPNLAA